MKSQKNIKKFSAMLLVIAMVMPAATVSATPGVDEPGVAGLFIDPIANITLNPAQLIDMQTNGLEIPVTGYAQYITATSPPVRPKLDQLYVRGYWWNGTGWDLDGTLINVSTVAGGPLVDTTIRTTLQGREFSDPAFSAATTPWKIYKTGVYNVVAIAHFTGGAEPVDDEGFTVTVVATITVYPMAAPNIAGIILEAEGVNPNQSIGKGKNRTFINLIAETAHHMGPQTLFDGVEKSIINGDDIEVCNPDYWDVVLNFLNGRLSYYGLGIGPLTYSLDDYIADL